MILNFNCRINNLIKSNVNDYLIFFSNKKIIIQNNKTQDNNIKQISAIGNCLGGFFENGKIVYYTENCIYEIFNDNIKKICEKNNFDCIFYHNDKIYVISEKNIDIITSSISTIPVLNRGICVRSIFYNNNLWLSYENGSICVIKNINTENFKIDEIINMSENITSFDVSNEKIVISYFSKKIAICTIRGENFIYTEIKYNPKIIKFWKNHIICLDSENNLFLLNLNLKVLYCENYQGNLIFFEVIEDVLYEIYENIIVLQKDIIQYIK